jgi:hypothetical protein
MLTSAVLAVALGLAPVQDDGSVDMARVSSAQIGNYIQTTDTRGTTHVHGRDAYGRSYELIMDRRGHVEASIGPDQVVTFDISGPA